MIGADGTAWAAAMRRRGLAAQTIRRRLSLLRKLHAAAPNGWRSCNRNDVERWLESLEQGPATMYATISHLRALYRWGRREGLVAQNPMELVEAPRVGRRLPRPAPDPAVQDALRTTDLTLRALLLLMALAGLRCCEAARLHWGDVELDTQRLWIRGKGDRDRVVALPGQLAGALARIRPDDAAPVALVFGWSAQRVSSRVNGHLRAINAGFTAHQLRHRYATRLLEETNDITIVQQALGHVSVATTQVYAHVDVSRVLAATAALHL